MSCSPRSASRPTPSNPRRGPRAIHPAASRAASSILVSLRPQAAALLFSALFASGTAIASDHRESYRAGVKARDRGQWSEVAHHMEAAIAQEPEAGGRLKIYGMRFETYAPYFHLGLARFQTGDCAAALAAWKQAERYGAVGRSEREEMETKGQDCRRRIGPDHGDGGGTARDRGSDSTKPASPSEAASDRGTVPPSRSAAGEASETNDFARNEPSEPPAPAGPSSFSADAEGERQPVSPSTPRLDPPELAPKEPRGGGPETASSPPDLGQGLESSSDRSRAEHVEKSDRESRSRGRTSPPRASKKTSPAPPKSGPSQPTSAPQAGDREATAALRRGAEAYLSADYREVVEILDPLEPGGPAELVAVLSLRAAARFALFREGQEKDEDLRGAAAKDVLALRSSAPEFQLDPLYFSPAFLRFFRSVR